MLFEAFNGDDLCAVEELVGPEYVSTRFAWEWLPPFK